jgi:hypothetical protein
MIKRVDLLPESPEQDALGSELLAYDAQPVNAIATAPPLAVVGGLVFGSSDGLSADQLGGFMEGVESDDLAVPILRLMQSQSPECQGKKATSKVGTFEISTLELAVDADETDIWFIPATFHKAWVERRGVGDGAPEKVAIYDREEDIDKSIYQYVSSKGAYIAQIEGSTHMIRLRHQHTGLVIIPSFEVITPAVIYASSTAIPNSKAFLAMYQGHATVVGGQRKVINPSAQLFKITAEEKSNGEQVWYVPKFNRVKSPEGNIAYAPPQLTQEALSLKQKVAESAVAFAEEEEYATVDVTADRVM